MSKTTKRKLNRPITQHDVAAEAGCSQNTVALALRNSPRISEKRREQIHRIARELGYRPNLAARSLRQRRSGLIGIFTGSLDQVRSQYVRALIAELHSTDTKPMLGIDPSSPSPWYKAPWIETFRMLQVEALVALSWHDDTEVPPWYREVPLVISGCQPYDHLPCDYVGVDRIAGGRMGTQMLIEKGYRKIAMYAGEFPRLVSQGYEQAMKAAGLTPMLVDAKRTPEDVQKLVKQFVQTKEHPDAMFVLNSKLASYVVKYLVDAGLRVPEDVAVLGYDALEWADTTAVALSTIEQPVADVTSKTIELTRRRVEEPGAEVEQIALDHKLCLRASV